MGVGTKVLITTIIVSLLGGIAFWLYQRQKNNNNTVVEEVVEETTENTETNFGTNTNTVFNNQESKRLDIKGSIAQNIIRAKMNDIYTNETLFNDILEKNFSDFAKTQNLPSQTAIEAQIEISAIYFLEREGYTFLNKTAYIAGLKQRKSKG